MSLFDGWGTTSVPYRSRGVFVFFVRGTLDPTYTPFDPSDVFLAVCRLLSLADLMLAGIHLFVTPTRPFPFDGEGTGAFLKEMVRFSLDRHAPQQQFGFQVWKTLGEPFPSCSPVEPSKGSRVPSVTAADSAPTSSQRSSWGEGAVRCIHTDSFHERARKKNEKTSGKECGGWVGDGVRSKHHSL